MAGAAPGQGTTLEAKVKVLNRQGLHARPSSVLAQNALRFKDTRISIRRGDLVVDAKSIMELLLLEARCGTELTVEAAGPQAREALEVVRDLFEREFDVKL